MIIEFDSEAIILRDAREKAKIEKEGQEKIFKIFYEDNKDILNFQLSYEEIQLFQKFKNKTKEETETLKVELEKDKKTIDKNLETDQSSQKKVADIQSSIDEIEIEEIDVSLSDYKEYQAVFNFDLKEQEYQAVFNFDLKEQVEIKAEQNLIEKLKLHKEFFETGFERKRKRFERRFVRRRTANFVIMFLFCIS